MRKLWLLTLPILVVAAIASATNAESLTIWLSSGNMQKTVLEVDTKNYSTDEKFCDTHIEYELQYPAINGVRILGFPKKEPIDACWYHTDFGLVGYARTMSRMYVKVDSQGENVIRINGQPDGLWSSLGSTGYLMFRQRISSYYLNLTLFENTKSRLTHTKTGWYDQYNYNRVSNSWVLPGFNGTPLGVNKAGYSQNGEWIVADTSHGFMRINTQTKDRIMFGSSSYGYGYGQDPSYDLSISNDGRYAIVAGGDRTSSIVRLYDLATCVYGANPLVIATGCTSRNIKADAFPELGTASTISRVIFGGDATDLIYNYPRADGKYDRMLLTAPGKEVHLMDYLALGDSYSSGEGEYEGETYYIKGTDGDGKDINGFESGLTNFPYGLEKCHISTRSYSHLLANQGNLTSNRFNNVACSGSTLNDIQNLITSRDIKTRYNGRFQQYENYPEPADILNSKKLAAKMFTPGRTAQIEFINEYKPKVATIGVGGNDIKFSDKLVSCLLPGTCAYEGGLRYNFGKEIQSLHGELVKTYSKLSEAGKSTKFYVVGYPQIASLTEECKINVRLDFKERVMARNVISYLNEVIKSAAELAGFTYLDVENSLAGKQLCDESDDQLAVQGLVGGDDKHVVYETGGIRFYIDVGNESFHPTHVGHDRIANFITAQLGDESLLEHQECVLAGGLRCPSGNTTVPPIPSYFTAFGTTSAEYVVDAKSFDSIYQINNNSGVKRGESIQLQQPLSGSQEQVRLAPNQTAQVTMYSTPQQVGIMTTDTNGNVTGSIAIPHTADPGPHTIVINTKDSLYRDMTMYQQVFVYDTIEDFDGDGTLNEDEKCGIVNPINQDEDRDGVDDACDGIIDIKKDTTVPTVTAQLSRQPNDNGWHKDDVSITWNVSDDTDTELAAPAQIIVDREGEDTYTSNGVCDQAGNCATGSVTIKLDKTDPLVTANIAESPSQNSWFNRDVNIDWVASDNLSTVTNPVDTVAILEGEHAYTSDSVCDQAGNCVSGNHTVKIDKTAPLLGLLQWSKNPKSVSEDSQLTANATETISTVYDAEYFIGEDPGFGNGATLQFDTNNTSTVLGTSFGTGVYKISARVQDAAGNWSATQSDYLVVYDATNGVRLRGARTIELGSSNTQLPWLGQSTSGQGKFAFSLRYGSDGNVTSQSDFQFAYKTGSNCNQPSKAINCHGFELNATQINWLTTTGSNQEIGIFRGQGILKRDSIEQNVSFTVSARDGERLSPIAHDVFDMTIYASDGNYGSTPLYFVAPTEVGRGNIKIKF
ncbi:MAG: SGNH/GDSL hydrolase family protein [Candidatus Saccharimonadales bacterium]